MKLIIVLSVIFVSVLGDQEILNRNRNNARNNRLLQDSESNESTPVVLQLANRSRNADLLSPEVLAALLKTQSQEQNNRVTEESPLGNWADNPDSAAFDAKIKARIASSKSLENKPEIRRKLNQLAEEKFNQCKGLVEDRERACFGRSTGQIMQLVAAVENMSRIQQ